MRPPAMPRPSSAPMCPAWLYSKSTPLFQEDRVCRNAVLVMTAGPTMSPRAEGDVMQGAASGRVVGELEDRAGRSARMVS